MSIHFDKPELFQLRKDGLNCVDMHFHSRYSDTFTKVSNIMKRAKQLGIGVAITDHNMIKGAAMAAKSGVMLVPGIEVSCFEGAHILFYFSRMSELTDFYIRYVKDYTEGSPYSTTRLHVDQLLDKADYYDCIISAAHPYTPNNWGLARSIKNRYVGEEILDKIHAVEVINGTQTEKVNLKAVHLAHSLGKPYTGGSDGHTLAALGGVVTVSGAHDVEGLLESIRKRKNTVTGESLPLIHTMVGSVKSLTKHMLYAVPTLRLKARRMNELSVKQRIRPKIQNGVDIMRDRPIRRVKARTKSMGRNVRAKLHRINSKRKSI